MKELRDNKSIAIALFGADAYRMLPIVSERLLVFDNLIADCFSKAKIKSLFRHNLNEFDIVRMMSSFFDQWKILHRTGNYSHQMRSGDEYQNEKMGWLLDLIAPELNQVLPPTLEYQIENHEKLVFYP